MAHFYGILQGSRGEVTRLGTKNTGIGATLASYQGAVDITLWHEGNVDMVRIGLKPWQGAGVTKSDI